jgi:hypothetical protein
MILCLTTVGCTNVFPFTKTELKGCYGINDFYKNAGGAKKQDGFNIQMQESNNWVGKYRFANDIGEKSVKFWFEKTENTDVESDRARVQLNMYALKDVKDFYLNSKFSLDASLSNYMDQGKTFEWLNIFELWVEPGWMGAAYPAKLHLRMAKNKGDSFLTPVISAQYKDPNEKEWRLLWSQQLDFEVSPAIEYNFKLFLSLEPTQSISAVISNISNEKTAFIKINKKFTHPSYGGVVASYWGVNL